MTTDQLKLERELQRIENVRIMDLSNALNVHDRNLEDFGLFREKSVEDLAKVQTATDQNFAAMAKEMQTVKSQIYYLQQSVLQLRGALQNTDESSVSPQTSLTASVSSSTLPNSQLDKLESQVEQCAAKTDIVALNDVFTSKTNEFTGTFFTLDYLNQYFIDGVHPWISLVLESMLYFLGASRLAIMMSRCNLARNG